MTWHKGTVYGFDIESTGVDVFTDRIITATIAKIVDGQYVDKREWLINPGIEIPEAATEVHGITTEHAREHGMDPAVAIAQIVPMIAATLAGQFPLVVFNAAYDLSLLEAEANRHSVPAPTSYLDPESWHTVIDPMVLAKYLEHSILRKFVKGRTFKLPALCERYKVPFVESHDATADATGAALLAIALVEAEPTFADYLPVNLFTLQKTVRRDQQRGLRAYFDKNGIDHDGVDEGWPLHSRLAKAVAA